MDVSAQLKAALSDRYIIEREIGAGGMATVYLARDVKHNRKVALKVLRPELGAVLGTERFLSEISVTANLQHPHLLPLFDSGEADGLLFYVMPFIQGESLRDRLDREKQLPVEEAVRIAVAAASALDYAHRHNVVHRDLKPENILLHDGQPVVADFGIALAVTNAGGTRVTQTGLSLGTPQYMSPEQATGDRVIDARSDIYSLGAVLYEMLTGEPPHIGHTVQAIIARVLTDRPHSVRSQRPSVPEHVEAATLRALEKLPADRFATAGEFAETLTGARGIVRAPQNQTIATYEVVPTSALARRRLMRAVPWAIAGIALALLAAVTLRPGQSESREQPLKFEITFTDSSQLVTAAGVNIALAPDGSRLAFTGMSGARNAIFVRRMDATEATPLRGTEEGMTPVFSPDSRWILFGQGGGLKKIPADGGPITSVVDSANPHTKAWGDGDVILYFWKNVLWKVSAAGGKPTPLAGQDTVGRLGALHMARHIAGWTGRADHHLQNQRRGLEPRSGQHSRRQSH